MGTEHRKKYIKSFMPRNMTQYFQCVTSNHVIELNTSDSNSHWGHKLSIKTSMTGE